jgi:gliding motility-associated protein GldL
MTKYSKFNVIYRLQKWLDSVPGQTFMNYAYSWGASIVILGTLFKLTHLPGANIMLFVGMGTEVVVFFIAAFDRPFDKTADGMELPTHVAEEDRPETTAGTGSGTIIINGGNGNMAPAHSTTEKHSSFPTAAVTPQAADAPVVDTEAIAAVSSAVTTMAGGTIIPPVPPSVNPELEEATANYVDELKRLTEMLSKVSEQSEHLTRDAEEMENLNRTLTGICKVYEMQLKGASAQIGTIDEINAHSKRMAEQIAELNKIYTRMIEAMTVNMPAGAPRTEG